MIRTWSMSAWRRSSWGLVEEIFGCDRMQHGEVRQWWWVKFFDPDYLKMNSESVYAHWNGTLRRRIDIDMGRRREEIWSQKERDVYMVHVIDCEWKWRAPCDEKSSSVVSGAFWMVSLIQGCRLSCFDCEWSFPMFVVCKLAQEIDTTTCYLRLCFCCW